MKLHSFPRNVLNYLILIFSQEKLLLLTNVHRVVFDKKSVLILYFLRLHYYCQTRLINLSTTAIKSSFNKCHCSYDRVNQFFFVLIIDQNTWLKTKFQLVLSKTKFNNQPFDLFNSFTTCVILFWSKPEKFQKISFFFVEKNIENHLGKSLHTSYI